MKSLSSIIICLLLSFSVFANEKAKGPTKSRFQTLELFNKVLYLIESQYYREVDSEKLIHGAIKGMMDTLDPHTTFLDTSVFKKMQEDTEGEFGGIGVEVTLKDGIVIVVTPLEDSPAHKAGILPGDKIIEINGESLIGFTLNESLEKMKTAKKKKMKLGIRRDGEEAMMNFWLKATKVKTNAVKFNLLGTHYAYIRISQFQKDVGLNVVKAIKSLKKKAKKHGGLKGIILDLRYNPGGLLDEAVNVSSVFLKDGVVVSTEGRSGSQKDIRFVKKGGYKELDLPLSVLINGASASASEIVAGAIQDLNRGVIMGTPSFGKGSVQTVTPIDETTGVKLTIAQYMTPTGKKIQAIGISPDVYLEDLDNEVFEKHRKSESYIREKDLRNHMMATKETKDEQEFREEFESLQRKVRKEKILEKNKMKKKKKLVSFDPATDYQVLQSIKLLQTMYRMNKVKKASI